LYANKTRYKDYKITFVSKGIQIFEWTLGYYGVACPQVVDGEALRICRITENVNFF